MKSSRVDNELVAYMVNLRNLRIFIFKEKKAANYKNFNNFPPYLNYNWYYYIITIRREEYE